MTPGKHDRLCVRVNNELVLDAGRCEEITGPRGPEKLIRMPPTTLFRQVLAYLESKPDPLCASLVPGPDARVSLLRH